MKTIIGGELYVLSTALSGEQVWLPESTRQYWWGRDFYTAQDAIDFAGAILENYSVKASIK